MSRATTNKTKRAEMKRILGMCLVVLSVAMVLEAGKKPTKGKIKVYVSAAVPESATTTKSGFVAAGTKESGNADRKRIEDSAQDVRNKLKKDDWLELVAAQEEADLEVSVISSGWGYIDGWSVNIITAGNAIFPDVTRLKNRFIGVGIYSREELVGAVKNDEGAISWGAAAGSVKKKLKGFVQENYDYILSLREETK